MNASSIDLIFRYAGIGSVFALVILVGQAHLNRHIMDLVVFSIFALLITAIVGAVHVGNRCQSEDASSDKFH